MNNVSAEPVRYYAVYRPDPEILEALKPSEGPVLSALGGVAMRQREQALYDTVKYDLVAHPGFNDPREYGVTGAEGYVDLTLLPTNKDAVCMIDMYYQPFFDDGFYRRHGLLRNMRLSAIIRQAYKTDENGEFIMSVDRYLGLLGDLQKFHSLAADEFDSRLPLYRSDLTSRLMNSELAGLAPRFQDRTAGLSIQLDDGFETLIYGAAGKHERWDKILISPNDPNEYGHYIHESAHALEGSGLIATFASYGNNYGNLTRGLREALASHIEAYLSFGGNINTIDPNARKRRTFSYDSERKMLDLLCNGGTNSISIHDIIDTFTSDVYKPNKTLLSAIESSFPDHPQLLKELNWFMDVLYVDENKIDPVHVAKFVEYLDNVKDHYRRARLARAMKSKLSLVNTALWRIISQSND